MPPTVTTSPSLRYCELGERQIDLAPQLVAHLGERMARQVQAERLLLEREQLAALELGLEQRRMVARATARRLDGLAEVEDRALAALRVRLRLLAGGERRLEDHQHRARAWRRSSRGRRT